MSGDKLKRQAVIDLALSWTGPMRAVIAPAPKQRIDIEALLRWAYLTELPKVPRLDAAPEGFRGAWDKVAQWVEELSLAGLDENRYGVVADFFAQSLPHNDALLIHAAVCDLDVLEVDGLDGFTPFEPQDGVDQALLDNCASRVRERVLTIGKDGKTRLRKPLRNLVFHAAILGGAPEWRIDDFVQDVERWENGAVKYFKKGGYWEKGAFGDVWVEYETAVAARPGYHREDDVSEKPILTPDPTDDAVSRVYHDLWRLALDVLAADLSGRLEKWDVTASPLPHRPWLEPAPRVGRVLRDLSRKVIRLRGGEKKISQVA